MKSPHGSTPSGVRTTLLRPSPVFGGGREGETERGGPLRCAAAGCAAAAAAAAVRLPAKSSLMLEATGSGGSVETGVSEGLAVAGKGNSLSP